MTERFDVVMPTLNSVLRVGRNIFRKVLSQIHKCIPLNRLLVVDDGSNDGTLEILKEFNAVVMKGVGNLGKAREIGIKNVDTEWFYFIDDDNIIPSKFHERMWAESDKNTGMIYSDAISPFDNYLVRYENIMGKMRRTFGFKNVWEIRGYTGATLVRTCAVKEIEIPNIARQEDRFIKNYIEQHGWKVKFLPSIKVLHFNRNLSMPNTYYLEGHGLAKMKLLSKTKMLISWLSTYPKTILAFPYVSKIKLLSDVPKMYYYKYLGYVNASEMKVKN
ncbi:MAG: glycosyltransferase family A protein [Nitrososphaeria archaeon]